MATKTAKKKKPKHGSKGHNSAVEKDLDELRKIAKAQLSLDRRKSLAMSDFREEHKNLTNRLEKAGFSRDEFKQPYADFVKIAECDTDEDAEIVKQNQKLFLANQRRAYDALSPGGQIDWIDLVQDADEIRKAREEAEKAAEAEAAEAAESAEDATDTPAEI